MISSKTSIIIGLILIIATLVVTGTTYKDTGTISMGVAAAAGISVVVGLGLIFLGGYLKK